MDICITDPHSVESFTVKSFINNFHKFLLISDELSPFFANMKNKCITVYLFTQVTSVVIIVEVHWDTTAIYKHEISTGCDISFQKWRHTLLPHNFTQLYSLFSEYTTLLYKYREQGTPDPCGRTHSSLYLKIKRERSSSSSWKITSNIIMCLTVWLSDTIWHHRTWSTLVQVMAWCLKPLPAPMLTYHQWGLVAFTWGKFHRKCSR